MLSMKLENVIEFLRLTIDHEIYPDDVYMDFSPIAMLVHPEDKLKAVVIGFDYLLDDLRTINALSCFGEVQRGDDLCENNGHFIVEIPFSVAEEIMELESGTILGSSLSCWLKDLVLLAIQNFSKTNN